MILDSITKGLLGRERTSMIDGSAVSVIRNMGGYTAIILNSLDQVLMTFKQNPRAVPVLEGIHRLLQGRVPILRSQVQKLLSHVHLEPYMDMNCRHHSMPSGNNPRKPLGYGLHSEVKLRSPELGWIGIADLVDFSRTSCEIRDFKSGSPKKEHELQARIYALLWVRERDLNPNGRFADRLVISYPGCDVVVPVPMEEELGLLESELKKRTAKAFSDLAKDPPQARISPDKCVYCGVRHLCDEYWQSHTQVSGYGQHGNTQVADLQVKLTKRHGSKSWDAVLYSPSKLQTGRQILLRTGDLQFDMREGQRLRLLNVYLSNSQRESFEDKDPPMAATLGANTEAFLLKIGDSGS
ncbi:MAG: hypothetical protein C4576_13445 [Desulfobacteraceae bacterium]|nr:MAG: hypothetical protein C4576_13445 [Desulfobacteraceae bacterium]